MFEVGKYLFESGKIDFFNKCAKYRKRKDKMFQ